LNSLYAVAYISATTWTTLTAALAAGTTTTDAYLSASSATSLASLQSTTDVRVVNAAFYCQYLRTSTTTLTAAVQALYNAYCLAASPPPPPTPTSSIDHDLWYIALIVVVVLITPLAIWGIFVWIRRRNTEAAQGQYEWKGPSEAGPGAATQAAGLAPLPVVLVPGSLRMAAATMARGGKAVTIADDAQVDNELTHATRQQQAPTRVYF